MGGECRAMIAQAAVSWRGEGAGPNNARSQTCAGMLLNRVLPTRHLAPCTRLGRGPLVWWGDAPLQGRFPCIHARGHSSIRRSANHDLRERRGEALSPSINRSF